MRLRITDIEKIRLCQTVALAEITFLLVVYWSEHLANVERDNRDSCGIYPEHFENVILGKLRRRENGTSMTKGMANHVPSIGTLEPCEVARQPKVSEILNGND